MSARLLLFLAALSGASPCAAQEVDFQPADSARVEQLLAQCASRPGGVPRTLYFGSLFLGSPYAAHTLEGGARERLVVNTREFDCATFVETVAALSLCDRHGRRTFADFCHFLRALRYRQGRQGDYTTRLHYFTHWADDNCRLRLLSPVDVPDSMARVQRVALRYMTANPRLYRQLRLHPHYVPALRAIERDGNGGEVAYLPKSRLHLPPDSLPFVRDGDIVALVTSRPGLDTSHLGIAVWRGRRLHLLHASSRRGRVISDTRTLADYARGQRTLLGIRLVRLSED